MDGDGELSLTDKENIFNATVKKERVHIDAQSLIIAIWSGIIIGASFATSSEEFRLVGVGLGALSGGLGAVREGLRVNVEKRNRVAKKLGQNNSIT